MDFSAPAKVNLYLNVVKKRSDGYHDIETVFERISLFDNITILETKEPTTIQCDDKSIPTDTNSLMGRTAELFLKEAKGKKNFKIQIKKNIPIGAGLGGGSSDAAALLMGMNKLSGDPLKKEKLVEIGRMLGADVPFFLSETSFAHGSGRGDIVESINTNIKIWHVLVKPPFSISTKAVYDKLGAFNLTKDIALDRILSAFFEENGLSYIVENLRNDLQQVVLRDFPMLEKVFEELRKAGALNVLVSGSGSTVFGIFDSKSVRAALVNLKTIFKEKEGWRVFAASTY